MDIVKGIFDSVEVIGNTCFVSNCRAICVLLLSGCLQGEFRLDGSPFLKHVGFPLVRLQHQNCLL